MVFEFTSISETDNKSITMSKFLFSMAICKAVLSNYFKISLKNYFVNAIEMLLFEYDKKTVDLKFHLILWLEIEFICLIYNFI